jgi:hypothetical protein
MRRYKAQIYTNNEGLQNAIKGIKKRSDQKIQGTKILSWRVRGAMHDNRAGMGWHIQKSERDKEWMLVLLAQ